MSESNAAESALARGRAYLEILRIPEAKEAFEEALVDEPEAVAPRVELARLHLARGERAEAERRLAEAEQRDPRDPSVLATRGLFALRTGDVDEARAAFEAALAKTPDDRMALVNLAACDRDAGDLAAAETSLRRALEVDPDAFDARFELAAVMSRTGRTEEAIRELLETVRRNPMHLKSILALGALYKLGGRGELAMALYARGLVYNPDAHPLREELRDLLALRLDLHGALRQAGELVRRRRHPSDLLAFGKLAVAAGEIERAEGAFRLARDLAPDDWAPHYDLAEVHRAAGFEDEAREGYERAVERANGDHPSLRGARTPPAGERGPRGGRAGPLREGGRARAGAPRAALRSRLGLRSPRRARRGDRARALGARAGDRRGHAPDGSRPARRGDRARAGRLRAGRLQRRSEPASVLRRRGDYPSSAFATIACASSWIWRRWSSPRKLSA
jgi:tetratricopeptide (TPR) repeat protein